MRDLGPCAGFADTPPGSVRMLGTSVQEVLQDRDERMRPHSYTWLIYDMYDYVDLVLIFNMRLFGILIILSTWFINGFWKGTNHAGFKSCIPTKKVIEFLLSM